MHLYLAAQIGKVQSVPSADNVPSASQNARKLTDSKCESVNLVNPAYLGLGRGNYIVMDWYYNNHKIQAIN